MRNLLVGVVILVLAVASGAALIFSGSPRDPIVEVNGGALEATFCRSATLSVTSGAEFLRNRSSQPVTVAGAKAVTATNARLAETAIVALTVKDATGAAPPARAQHRAVPAVIPPAASGPTVKAWQLVFTVRVADPGHRATLKGVLVTFHQGSRTYHLDSQLHDVIEATGVSPARC